MSPIPWPQEGNWSSPGRQSRSRIHCSFSLKSIQCCLVSLKLILECKLPLIIMKFASNSSLAQPIQPDDVEECSQRFHFRFTKYISYKKKTAVGEVWVTVLAVVRSFFGAQAWIGMPQNRRTARHRKFTISVTVFTIRSSRELFFVTPTSNQCSILVSVYIYIRIYIYIQYSYVADAIALCPPERMQSFEGSQLCLAFWAGGSELFVWK